MIADQTFKVFFAQWCGHCKNLKPHWKSAAEVKFGAVDATVHQELLAHEYEQIEYGVRGKV